MLAIERRNEILAKLTLTGKVIVSDLAMEFGVTEETIRRDLDKLDKDGFLKKTYGGAVKTENFHTDLPFYVRRKTNVESKQHIAARIADRIEDGSFLMLDASSTALFVVQHILHRKNITLITNSIEILLELSGAGKLDWNILSTGGALKDGSLSLVGYQAEKMVGSFQVDMAVCSCKGIDRQRGITDSNERDMEMKRAFFASAREKVLAADDTKFDKVSFAKVCDLGEIDMLVTNRCPSDEWVTRFEKLGVPLVY